MRYGLKMAKSYFEVLRFFCFDYLVRNKNQAETAFFNFFLFKRPHILLGGDLKRKKLLCGGVLFKANV